MASLLNLSDDAVNRAMVDGLVSAFKEELRKPLMAQAVAEVEAAVEVVSKRVAVRINRAFDPRSMMERVDLTWILKKEDE